MRFANGAIVAAGVGFALAALVGCGGSGGLLDKNQAAQLSNDLDLASSQLAGNSCAAAQRTLRNLSDKVDGLQSVNQTLVANLQQGVSTTEQLAARSCPVAPRTRTTPNTNSTTTKTDTSPATTTATQPATNTETTPTTSSTSPTSTNPSGSTTTPPPSGGTGLPSNVVRPGGANGGAPGADYGRQYAWGGWGGWGGGWSR